MAFRVICRKQRLVSSCISSHCLSTSVPPPGPKTAKTSVKTTGTTGRQSINGVLPNTVNRFVSRGVTDPIQAFRDASRRAANRRETHVMARAESQLNPEENENPSVKPPVVPSNGPADYQHDVNAFYRQVSTDFPVTPTRESVGPATREEDASGPDPEYNTGLMGITVFRSEEPLQLKYGGVLPELEVAYETWGELNEERDNAVIISAGLSAASHAKSHPGNKQAGWWEKFVGPGCAVDTDKYFVICTNNLGGCHGSTGPSSINPMTGMPYGSSFPMISIEDMVRAHFLLLDHLGIDKVYCTVGSSLGGMLSLTAAVLFPERVSRVVSISAAVSSHPTSIAMRYLQRRAIMTDPNWNNGHYYNSTYPKNGMKLAREIATLTYRSGPEWEQRFNRKRIQTNEQIPSINPTFLIESYLDYQGEAGCMKLDPNSLIYVSKAMDLFDLGESFGSLRGALQNVVCPVMVIGVQTDLLFPVWQQREMATVLQEAGNNAVTYYELNSIYGHDTFLLDLNGVGAGIKGFLETELVEKGRARKQKDH